MWPASVAYDVKRQAARERQRFASEREDRVARQQAEVSAFQRGFALAGEISATTTLD
jgi:hypothetical protein